MIVVVTGLMRSGTSRVAQMLHEELGVPMGVRMRFPMHGAGLDWEEDALSAYFASLLMGVAVPYHPEDWLSLYFENREDRLWGMKSPLLMPYRKDVDMVAAGYGHETRWIVTSRHPEECEASIRDLLEGEVLARVLDLQHLLEGCWLEAHNQADLVVDNGWLRSSPAEVAEAIRLLVKE